MKTNVHLRSYLAVILRIRNAWDKIVQTIKTNICMFNYCFWKDMR